MILMKKYFYLDTYYLLIIYILISVYMYGVRKLKVNLYLGCVEDRSCYVGLYSSCVVEW